MLSKNNLSAEKRIEMLADAVESEKFGEVPEPPTEEEPLNRLAVDFLFSVDDDNRARVAPDQVFTVEELQYLFDVAEKLGFNPQWVK